MPCWLTVCSSWCTTPRFFLSSCSSLDACERAEIGPRVTPRENLPCIFLHCCKQAQGIFCKKPFTSSSDRCTLAPSFLGTGVPPSTVGMTTTRGWLLESCLSLLGSCWKVELRCNALRKATCRCEYHVSYTGYTLSTGLR